MGVDDWDYLDAYQKKQQRFEAALKLFTTKPEFDASHLRNITMGEAIEMADKFIAKLENKDDSN